MTNYYYYRVRNDVIKRDTEGVPTWTDEPLWLRKEIDTWDQSLGGGRFFADSDAQYSYIVSPKELISPVGDDLIELTEQQILLVVAQAFPPSVIVREGEPDEIIPTPSLSHVCSIWWGYATNHTGTISTNETWALADNDHHITGNITVNANVTLTIAAGVNVYWDGSYTITRQAGSGGTTTITAVGTAQLPITMESNASRTNTALFNAITTGFTGANNTSITLQYCNIANFTTFISAISYTSYSITLDHLSVRDCDTFIVSSGASTVPTFNISNSRFIRMYGSTITFGTLTSGTYTHTITDCEWRQCTAVILGTNSGGTNTVNYIDGAFLDRTVLSPTANSISAIRHSFARCLFDCTNISYTGAGIPSLSGCIYTRATTANAFASASTATNNTTLTTCDIMGHGTNSETSYAVVNQSSTGNTITMESCYVSAYRGADIFNYYTGSEIPAQMLEHSYTTLSPTASTAPAVNAIYATTNAVSATCTTSSTTAPVFKYSGTTHPISGAWSKVSGTGDASINVSAVTNATIVITTPRSTRNFPFTQSSISAGSITSSSATISWTGAFKTMNRLAVGTTSGTYTTTYTKDDSWTNYDNKGKMTTSPSFALTGLSAGTTYYYVCQSWDWVRQMWNQSAENSFTTLPSQPISYGSFN